MLAGGGCETIHMVRCIVTWVVRFRLRSFRRSWTGVTPAGSLTIGTPAPVLDIEHWVTNAGGRWEPVTGFKRGQVYVVEFWATWCPPCRDSIPHLAELQERYAHEVQVIGVSDEPVQKVQAFLNATSPTGSKFGEFAEKYCLTTDPDGSTENDYMVAAGMNSIPTAFIVGKDSRIVWIGHPMDLDRALEIAVTAPFSESAGGQ